MTAVRRSWHHRALAGAVLLSLLTSCSKKDGSGSTAPPTTPPVSGPTATVTGLVIGASGNGLPLSGVAFTATPTTGATATSNSFGVFTLTIPAGQRVAVTGRRDGFAPHPMWFELAAGETRSAAVVMAPHGGSLFMSAGSGGRVTDPGTKASILLPPNFVTGTPNAVVAVTGIDPTSPQVLAMPGTFAAQNSFGGALSLEPIAMAEFEVGDGDGTSFPLQHPAEIELRIPTSKLGDARLRMGATVNVMRYDAPAGVWRYYADGTVVSSAIDGQPAIRATVTGLSWFAAGFLFGSNACLEGVVKQGVVPVAGAHVQAYPGGVALTNASGFYRVSVPPETQVRLVATKAGVSSIASGSATATSIKLGAGCVETPIALSNSGAPSTFIVQARLSRARDANGLQRDAAEVRIAASSGPLLSGALVELSNSSTQWVLPLRSPGVYAIVAGQQQFVMPSGDTYRLRIDLEPDGVIDGEGEIFFPGKPFITAPDVDATMDPSFGAGWTESLASSEVRYIGSVESLLSGQFPVVFALMSPANSKSIGDGVGQPEFSMPNEPLASGPHLMRLWATTGPVRYSVGGTTQFATPNINSSRILGWFSAIVRADSVPFGVIGGDVVIGSRVSGR